MSLKLFLGVTVKVVSEDMKVAIIHIPLMHSLVMPKGSILGTEAISLGL